MTRTDFITANAAYLPEDDLAQIESMSDDDWAALVALCEETFESEEPGIDCRIVRVASGSVGSFDEARAHWSERGSREDCTANDRACAIYRDVQTIKGQQRQTIAVMPQGDAALVLQL